MSPRWGLVGKYIHVSFANDTARQQVADLLGEMADRASSPEAFLATMRAFAADNGLSEEELGEAARIANDRASYASGRARFLATANYIPDAKVKL